MAPPKSILTLPMGPGPEFGGWSDKRVLTTEARIQGSIQQEILTKAVLAALSWGL
jgi:hypothetical protein